jgi:hypothetical protein
LGEESLVETPWRTGAAACLSGCRLVAEEPPHPGSPKLQTSPPHNSTASFRAAGNPVFWGVEFKKIFGGPLARLLQVDLAHLLIFWPTFVEKFFF